MVWDIFIFAKLILRLMKIHWQNTLHTYNIFLKVITMCVNFQQWINIVYNLGTSGGRFFSVASEVCLPPVCL